MQTKPALALAIAALGLPILFGQTVHAQANVTPAPVQIPHRLEHLAAKLSLTPQQQAQAQAILVQARAQRTAIANDSSLTAAQRHQADRKLSFATRKRLAALLSPAQRKKAHAILRHRLVRMADKLGVTAAQRSQIKGIIAYARQQVKATRADTALTAAQKKTERRAIFVSARRQALAVLTPAQRQEFLALKAARQAKRK